MLRRRPSNLPRNLLLCFDWSLFRIFSSFFMFETSFSVTFRCWINTWCSNVCKSNVCKSHFNCNISSRAFLAAESSANAESSSSFSTASRTAFLSSSVSSSFGTWAHFVLRAFRVSSTRVCKILNLSHQYMRFKIPVISMSSAPLIMEPGLNSGIYSLAISQGPRSGSAHLLGSLCFQCGLFRWWKNWSSHAHAHFSILWVLVLHWQGPASGRSATLFFMHLYRQSISRVT